MTYADSAMFEKFNKETRKEISKRLHTNRYAATSSAAQMAVLPNTKWAKVQNILYKDLYEEFGRPWSTDFQYRKCHHLVECAKMVEKIANEGVESVDIGNATKKKVARCIVGFEKPVVGLSSKVIFDRIGKYRDAFGDDGVRKVEFKTKDNEYLECFDFGMKHWGERDAYVKKATEGIVDFLSEKSLTHTITKMVNAKGWRNKVIIYLGEPQDHQTNIDADVIEGLLGMTA